MNTANSLGAPLNSQVQVDQRLTFQEVHRTIGMGNNEEARASRLTSGFPKNGGDLLSQLVGQYHRRG